MGDRQGLRDRRRYRGPRHRGRDPRPRARPGRGRRVVSKDAPGPMTGLSHVQLRVSDTAASARWYTAALGLEPYRADPEIGYVALRHPGARVVMVLTEAADIPWQDGPGPLDHLAF